MSNSQESNALSRRNMLKGIGAGVAATALAGTLGTTTTAGAQNPTVISNNTAFYRHKVGTFEVTIINDGTLALPTAVLGTNAPEGALAKLLADSYLPTDVFAAPAHVMLVNTGSKLVLIDTGLGGVALPGFETDTGKLLPTLTLLGIDPAKIDTVILSHAHPDHVGGILNASSELNFPNATVYVSKTEFDFWMAAPTNSADQLANLFASVAQKTLKTVASRLQTFMGETQIVPGLTALPAPGHTPGHYAVLVGTGKERVLNIADTALHYVVGLEAPGWYAGLEIDPKTAEQTRKTLFTRASEERLKVFGYHFPFPGFGYVVRNDGEANWRYVVAD